MRNILRLFASAAIALFLFAFASPGAAVADAPKSLRIGYQKTSALLIVKQQGLLEKRLQAQGVSVQWVEFQSGPPLIEALNAGAIDFGYTGDTPPIFAQAAGVNFVYVASIPAPGASNAILVRKDSGITTLADLRGKRIALVKGSSAHNVLVQVLAKAGIAYGDIRPVYLAPADAGAAFRSGSVDAWSIWDPFYAVAQRDPNTRVLTDAQGIAPSNSFFLASRDYASAHPDVIKAVVEETTQAWHWAQSHQAELAQLLSEATGVDLAAEKIAAARGNYEIAYLTPAVVRQQQSIADAFAKLGLLPHPIDVHLAVWTASGSKSLTAAPAP
jgi:aliphatic sulfonates family ABC transporter substrate-binding protein